MEAELFKRAQELFARAVQLPADERGAYLIEASGGDAALRAEVEQLLRHDAEIGSRFLEPDDRADQTQNTPAPDEAPPVSGPTIVGYELLCELSRGGQGVVYQALQRSTKRKVAIKVLLEGPYASKAAQRRFEREVELIAQLKHPNVIGIFDSGVTPDGRHYYVMDYVRGVPLHRYAREQHLTLEDTLELFAKVCDAVQYAHQKGVIHRDLKPTNILVDGDAQPKLMDFGLARLLAGPDQSVVSLSQSIVGTLPYMSPEQARGNAEEIDTRTDVYALGVILYELLTGCYPYPVAGEMIQALRHITETPPTPPSRSWKPDAGVSRGSTPTARGGHCPIDEEVESIVLRALAKERERRYQSVGELRRDVAHYRSGEPIEAKRDSGWYVLKKQLRRHRVPVVTAVVLLGVCLVAMVTSLALWRQAAQAERRKAELLTAVAATMDAICPMLDPAANIEPDRNKVVRAARAAAEQDLARCFSEVPGLEANVRFALAAVSTRIGDFERAKSEAERAIALRSEEFGAQSIEAVAAKRLLMRIEAWIRHYESESLGSAQSDARSGQDGQQARSHLGPVEPSLQKAIAGRYVDQAGATLLIEPAGEELRAQIHWSPPNGPVTHAIIVQDPEGGLMFDDGHATYTVAVHKDADGAPDTLSILTRTYRRVQKSGSASKAPGALAVGATSRPTPKPASASAEGRPPIDDSVVVIVGATGKAINELVAEAESRGFSGAVLTAIDGEVVCAVAVGNADLAHQSSNTPATLFEIASVTKQFTAAAIMWLVDEGKVRLDDSISTYLPGVPEDCRAITVEHLLRHTSGIPGTNSTGSGDDIEWVQPFFLKGGPVHAPGTHWEYWNQGYALLSEIVRRASGVEYTEFCREQLFKPAGMTLTCFTGDPAPAGAEVAVGSGASRARSALEHPYGSYGFQYRGMGGVVTNVWDLWRWDRALAGTAVLSEAAKSTLFERGLGGYALGWFVERDVQGQLVHKHSGSVRGFCADVRRYPERDAFIAVLANRDDAPAGEIAARIEALLFE